jgi:hypothetical protein
MARLSIGSSFAAGLVLISAGTAAQAIVMPGCTANSSLFEHTICGAAEGQGEGLGEAYTASPLTQASFANDVGGSFAVAGAGTGAVNSSASGSGTFGEIHLMANADNGQFQTPSFDKWGQASAMAQIAFGDGGVVTGFPIGTPITVRLAVSVDGAFAGAADAGLSFMLQDGQTQLVNLSGITLTPYNTSYLYTEDLTIYSGDALHFYMELSASAATTNKDYSTTYLSSADVSHTGRLFFDILTPGATFASYSGHDYSSLAPPAAGVPEPAIWATMILGFCGVGLGLRRDRREPRLCIPTA